MTFNMKKKVIVLAAIFAVAVILLDSALAGKMGMKRYPSGMWDYRVFREKYGDEWGYGSTYHPGIIPPVNPYGYDLTLTIPYYECIGTSNGTCIEGDDITFIVSATAFKGPDKTPNFPVFIRDIMTNASITEEIVVDGLGNFTINATAPEPTNGALYYTPCFKFRRKAFNISDMGTACNAPNYSIQVLPLSEIQCRDDDECAAAEACEDFKCVGLSCGDCQNIEDHVCKSYACCSDSDCGSNENCENHKCVEKPVLLSEETWQWVLPVMLVVVLVIIVGLIVKLSIRPRKRSP